MKFERQEIDDLIRRVFEGDRDARSELTRLTVSGSDGEEVQSSDPSLIEPTATTVKRLMERGVPKRIATFALAADFSAQRESWGVTQRWLQAIERGHTRTLLVLRGITGTGKSVAAARALSLQRCDLDPPDNLERGWDWLPKWVSAIWYAKAVLPSASEDDQERVRRAETASFLVIDDFGMEKETATGHAVDQLANLVITRIEEMRPTILTTNMDTDLVSQRYGLRLASKIMEAGVIAKLSDQVDMRKGEGLN